VANKGKLRTYLGSKDNNFNLIRFVAASMVLFSHSYPLGGFGLRDGLSAQVGLSLGGIAVDIFS